MNTYMSGNLSTIFESNLDLSFSFFKNEMNANCISNSQECLTIAGQTFLLVTGIFQGIYVV